MCTQIKMMTNHLPCGPEVTIDMTADTTKEEIKQKLVVATGVPVEHQKIMMSGITQICMGDKRCERSPCSTFTMIRDLP